MVINNEFHHQEGITLSLRGKKGKGFHYSICKQQERQTASSFPLETTEENTSTAQIQETDYLKQNAGQFGPGQHSPFSLFNNC